MSITPKEHLGDGVYAHHDGYHIVLSAYSSGHNNIIYLEPEVMDKLKKYEQSLKS